MPSRQHPGRAAGRAWSTRWSTSTARARSPRPTSSSSTRPKGQEIAAQNYLPAAQRRRSPPSTRRSSRSSQLFTIDQVFGGWTKAQKTHFADGGVFDQIYQAEVNGSARRVARRMRRRLSRRGSVLPGFGLTLGFTLFYSGLHRPDPARRRCSSSRRRSAGARSGATSPTPRALAALPAQLRRRRSRAALINAVFGAAGRLGAGALPLPGQAARRRAGRPAVRAADRGRRHRARPTLYAQQRLDRRASWRRSASRSPSRRSGIVVALPSSACRSWCARCSRCCEDLDPEVEEAAASLGATRWQTFRAGDPARRCCRRC